MLGTGTPSLCIPCGTALGATWNPELVEELGGVLAAETRARGCHVLLAPTVTLHRTPLGGRNFECMSEDPFLTGQIAVGFIRGVQAGGVGTTVKHFVANDSEFGLSGSVTGGDLERATAVAHRIRTGTIAVNGGVWFSPDAPFGGYKQSGLGREMGVAGFEEYLETKTLAFPA